MIKISITYEIISPESAEEGEVADTGFVREDDEVTFGDLVRLMRVYRNPSCWPPTGATYEWLNGNYETDYRTGEERLESLHFERDNAPRAEKYWAKAMRAAGILPR